MPARRTQSPVVARAARGDDRVGELRGAGSRGPREKLHVARRRRIEGGQHEGRRREAVHLAKPPALVATVDDIDRDILGALIGDGEYRGDRRLIGPIDARRGAPDYK